MTVVVVIHFAVPYDASLLAGAISQTKRESVAVNTAKIDLWNTVKQYWLDEKTNVFNNYIDAVFGVVVLVVFPAASLATVFFCETVGWSNYVFPIISVAGAGMYDAYGRCSVKERSVKLSIRVAIDSVAIILAAFFSGTNSLVLWAIPPFMLLICGVGLLFEACERIKVAIEISEWSVLK